MDGSFYSIMVTVNQLVMVCLKKKKKVNSARLLNQNCQSTCVTAECPILKKRDKFSCKGECSSLKTAALLSSSGLI